MPQNLVRFAVTPLAATVALCCCQAALAQENASKHVVADTVVVTAARTGQDLLDVNSSVSVVRPDATVNATLDNVPDMLRRETGVNLVNDGTPGLKRIALRGESASRTLVMVNGQRIDDQKNKSGVPLLINPFFIDRIEVVKGPASVLYGSDALGGIVNVIAKRPVADKAAELEAGAVFSSATEGFTEFANVSGTKDSLRYAFGAFNTDQGDIYMSGHKRLDNTDYSAHGFNAILGYDISERLSIEYDLEYYDLDANTSTTVEHPVYSVYRAEMPEWKRVKHTFSMSATDINDYIAAVNASFYVQSNDKTFNSWPQRGLTVDVVNNQDTMGGNLQAEFSLSDTFYLVTGYDGRVEKLDSSGSVGIRMGPVAGAFDINDRDYKQQSHALYAMLSTYLTDELTLNTGVRYNRISTDAGTSSVTGQMNVPGAGAIPVNMSPVGGDTVKVKTIGSAGLVYRPFDYGAFRLNWSQGFRVPNIQELYLVTSTGTLQFGNPDLKPEESNNYELGFRWDDPDGLIADVALFYTDADNYIENAAVQGGRFFTYQNIARAKTYGVEAGVSYLFDEFEPYVNVTRMEREYKTPSGSSKNTGTPEFKGNAGLRYYGSLFDADAYVSFASDSVNDNLDGSSYMGANRWGGYVTYNLSLSATFGEQDRFKVFGTFENIFDKRYQTSELIHEPGRFFTVGIRGRF